MPEMTEYAAGTPIWVDVATSDLDGARKFYGALFGWESEDGDPDFGGYTMFTKGGKMVAGVGPVMDPSQPVAWSTYLAVDDVDKTTEQVTAAAGQVLVPAMTINDAGRMAVYADPTGAAVGVWQPDQHRGFELVNEPGTVVWNELATRDVDAAKAFYSAALGLEPKASEFDDTYTTLHADGRPVAGLMNMPEGYPPQVPAHWSVYFAVEDTDATVARLTELGGVVRMPAFDTPPGRTAVLADPYGAVFAVIAMNPDFQTG
ncbi:MAG TPA: VOC family protein [Mycobacteriales bacterium]|nr:VOC family protein [Mycobacteriales bacterium]